MKDYKKRFKQIIIMIMISVVIGCGFAALYGACHYMKADIKGSAYLVSDTSVTTNLTAVDGVYQVTNDGGSLILKFPKRYINKFEYKYLSKGFSTCTISVNKDNVFGQEEEVSITDRVIAEMPRSVVNINGYVSEIRIDFPESNNTLQISDFMIDNDFKFNPLLAIFVMGIVFLTLFLIVLKKENAMHPGIATFVLILVVASLLMVVEPTYVVGWDEQIHYRTSLMLGTLQADEPETQADDYLYSLAPELNQYCEGTQESIEERFDMIRILNTKQNYQGYWTDNHSWVIGDVGRLNQAIFLKIAEIIHAPFYLMWLMGKFANILLYALLMGLSVHLVPIGKRVLMTISLLPIMVFISTIYTYDVTNIAFIILATSIMIREFVYKDQVFRYRWRTVFLLSFIIGCMPKAVFAPLIFGALFFGKDKFYSKRDGIIFRSLVMLTMLGLLSTFVLPTAVAPSEKGDSRGGNTSVAGQMSYVLGQPIAYARLLITNIMNCFIDYITCFQRASFAYLGGGNYAFITSGLLVTTALTDSYSEKGTKRSLDWKTKVVFLMGIAATIVLIWTALYISYTEVGVSEIAGVQLRYYLPFLFLFYVCFLSEKVKCNFQKANYQLTVNAISLGVLLQQIYETIILTKCF